MLVRMAVRSPLICKVGPESAESGAEFVGDDVGQRRFARGRAGVKQDVIEGFAAGFGGLDGYVEILFDFILADEFLEPLRPKLQLKRRIVLDRGGGDERSFKAGLSLAADTESRCSSSRYGVPGVGRTLLSAMRNSAASNRRVPTFRGQECPGHTDYCPSHSQPHAFNLPASNHATL